MVNFTANRYQPPLSEQHIKSCMSRSGRQPALIGQSFMSRVILNRLICSNPTLLRGPLSRMCWTRSSSRDWSGTDNCLCWNRLMEENPRFKKNVYMWTLPKISEKLNFSLHCVILDRCSSWCHEHDYNMPCLFVSFFVYVVRSQTTIHCIRVCRCCG